MQIQSTKMGTKLTQGQNKLFCEVRNDRSSFILVTVVASLFI